MSKTKAQAKTKDPGESFTGVAYTVQASVDQNFPNYRICTVFVVDGEIVHIEKTQPYASYEAIARTEIFVNRAIWNLSARYRHGLFQSTGGEQRDELINRLKKKNPDLLRKIAPALGYEEGTPQ